METLEYRKYQPDKTCLNGNYVFSESTFNTATVAFTNTGMQLRPWAD